MKIIQRLWPTNQKLFILEILKILKILTPVMEHFGIFSFQHSKPQIQPTKSIAWKM